MAKVQTTIRINNDTSNPINVECVINGDYEFPRGWDYEIEEIKSVELVVSDKQGVDITKAIFSEARAKAFILSQVGDEADQITEAFSDTQDENVQIDEMRERVNDNSLFNQVADMCRNYNKIIYGIDTKGGQL